MKRILLLSLPSLLLACDVPAAALCEVAVQSSDYVCERVHQTCLARGITEELCLEQLTACGAAEPAFPPLLLQAQCAFTEVACEASPNGWACEDAPATCECAYERSGVQVGED